MNKKNTFWQRLTSETPVFFKKIQVLGLGLVTLGGSLAAIPGIPAVISTGLITAGSVMAAVAQFAVQQSAAPPKG